MSYCYMPFVLTLSNSYHQFQNFRIFSTDNEGHPFVKNARFDIVNQNVLLEEESMETAFALSPAIQIDDSDNDEVVVEVVETVSIGGRTTVARDG